MTEEAKLEFPEEILLPGGQFQPLVYLTRVDEPEFGCEGRPENGGVYGVIYGETAHGTARWQVEEALLWQGGFDDGMWVGRWQGGYATLKRGKAPPAPLDAAVFAAVFGGRGELPCK